MDKDLKGLADILALRNTYSVSIKPGFYEFILDENDLNANFHTINIDSSITKLYSKQKMQEIEMIIIGENCGKTKLF